VTPAPPITAQSPGLSSIICAELVLSNAPCPRICAALGPGKFKLYLGGAGVTLAPPNQPIGTGQAPPESSEFVLSIPLGPRMCAVPKTWDVTCFFSNALRYRSFGYVSLLVTLPLLDFGIVTPLPVFTQKKVMLYRSLLLHFKN